MDENKKTQAQPEQEDKPTYTPASFEKRVAAWVGVVYMVMLVVGIVILIATHGAGLANTFPLLLPPAAVGAAIIGVYREVKGKNKEGRYFTWALVFLCVAAFAIGVISGLPPLLANLGIATPFIPQP